MDNQLDYGNIMKEISHILADEEQTEHKMGRHYIEGQILAIIQKYDARRNIKVI